VQRQSKNRIETTPQGGPKQSHDDENIEMGMETDAVDAVDARPSQAPGLAFFCLRFRVVANQSNPSMDSRAARFPQVPPDGRSALASKQTPVLPLFIRFNFDVDETCTRSHVAHIYHQSYKRLNGLEINVIKNNKRYPVVLDPDKARHIVNVLFTEMLGTTMNQVREVMTGIEAYKTTRKAEATGADEAAPDAIRRFLTSSRASLGRTRLWSSSAWRSTSRALSC
jgi:hypothetical protein